MIEPEGKANRKARFRTVFALIEHSGTHYFNGEVKGEIISELRGNTGFGYDPVFVPEGFNETFAELGSEIKNKISHRALAVKELKQYLKKA